MEASIRLVFDADPCVSNGPPFPVHGLLVAGNRPRSYGVTLTCKHARGRAKQTRLELGGRVLAEPARSANATSWERCCPSPARMGSPFCSGSSG